MNEKNWLKKLRILIEYIFVLVVLLECNSAYRCISDRIDITYKLQQISIVCSVLLIAILLIEKRKFIDVFFECSILLCGIFAFDTVFLLINVRLTQGIENYIYAFMLFLPLTILLFKIYRACDLHMVLFFRLSDIVFGLAIVSLVFWFLSSIISVIQPIGSLSIDWGWRHEVKNFYYLYLPWESQNEYISVLNCSIVRNIGIFTESPMYNIFLNSALYIELFLTRKVKKYRIIILALTIVSTFSTMGFMLMLLALYLKFVLYVIYKKGNLKIVFGTFCIITLCFLMLLINKWNTGKGSFSTHIQLYFYIIKAWLSALLLGCGYDNVSFIINYMPEERTNLGLSNSIGTVLAQGGIVLTAFFFVPFGILLKNVLINKNYKVALWAMGMIALYVVTIFHYRFYLMLLLAFGYSFFDIHQKRAMK